VRSGPLPWLPWLFGARLASGPAPIGAGTAVPCPEHVNYHPITTSYIDLYTHPGLTRTKR
jgi:hypothetical protein